MADIEKEDIKILKELEDTDIKAKKKVKRDHKIEKDDVFYRVKLRYNNYSKICRTKQKNLPRGEYLIVPTPYGNEIGYNQGEATDMDDILSQEEILKMVRVANDRDRKKLRESRKKEAHAFKITVKKIADHGLEMKLVNVHSFLEDSKILFNFTADGRVDFRELVKDLASVFKTRIELRQIGVRDECRIMNGYGQCGKHLCCSNVLHDLEPITIKMAKEQNITLNSLKISGCCGRLLCCLAYEYKTYLEEKEIYPVEGARIKVNGDMYICQEVNIQTKQVKLTAEKAHELFIYVNLNEINLNKDRKSGIVKNYKE